MGINSSFKPPKMIDNKRNGRVIDEIKDNIRKGSKLSVISAYFTIYAFSELKKELSHIDNMRFIFTEPTFINKDAELIREYYLEKRNELSISGNEFEIKLRNEMKQAAIAKECARWLEDKVQIKSLKVPNAAQPRLVYIENQNTDTSISGTVDFTSDGLGITKSDRIDSNMCIYGKELSWTFLKQFDDLWSDPNAVEDVKEQVLEHMRVLYKENTTEFIYFVTLYHIFEKYLDELTEDNIVKSKTGFKETEIWNKLYKFQQDGVMGIIDKIEKHNGCILADSVGLGKTFTALAVIKYYELRNDRVLVLTPKKLHENWSVYTQNDKRNLFSKDRFNYDVLNHTDLSRDGGYSGEINLSTINWANYDLVMIDESHNFRNNSPVKGRITRYEKLMNEVIKAGVKTKILMLSATPVNNRMNDIKNQIAFITEGKSGAFADVGLNNLEHILRKAQLVFNKWSSLSDEERTTDTFVEMMDLDYFKLLDTVTIARSRKHIEKYYNLAEIGKFPERMPPKNKYTDIDLKGEFPSISEVNKQIKKLTLCVYSPLAYVRGEMRNFYSEKYDAKVGNSIFKQTDRESSLVDLMRVNILKRMESSIHSFSLTVEKILTQIIETITSIEDFKSGALNISVSQNITESDEEEDFDAFSVGNAVKVNLADMDLIKWKQDLLWDKEQLQYLLDEARKITPERDAKLKELKKVIKDKLENPINENNKKIIIFSAFADTAAYLYMNLSPYLNEFGIASAVVSGSTDNKTTLNIPKELKKQIKISDLNTVLTLFSPVSKERAKIFPEMNGEIDLLIGTDCISEGQNLQDCDFLINYDIHWNPVRIIQRFGRIDRIGSKNGKIQLVNFWPTKDLDEYINLQQRVKGRMVLLDVSATGEENLIEQNESREMKDLEYRKKQLISLQNTVVDLEDISGGISITDLTFSDFKADLMEALKENRKQLNDAPHGMYAVATIPDSVKDVVKPGVIFTLKQSKGAKQTKEQNPQFPYYMAYVTDDGEVKLNFVHAKKILDIYKKLCKGQKEILQDIIAEFNEQTDDGRNMDEYTILLQQAIENLIGKKQEVGVASLFSKGGGIISHENFDGIEDFELITFLVIK
ncbi:RNA polymerase-associated protein RapA [Anaerotignum neopropionicum]|uniref:RNA polymerase-associated protein RapA n=1 Tax=Anaerotignum neopropionicum TaxID=36847 RepID=A0A136WGU7_9FIRM|nr:helicase-related protein [Anaerotignum neopropionicum]KXL53687.1 RNA polymerase-associated protein RapA [Anaerotignum neopropionicum]